MRKARGSGGGGGERRQPEGVVTHVPGHASCGLPGGSSGHTWDAGRRGSGDDSSGRGGQAPSGRARPRGPAPPRQGEEGARQNLCPASAPGLNSEPSGPGSARLEQPRAQGVEAPRLLRPGDPWWHRARRLRMPRCGAQCALPLCRQARPDPGRARQSGVAGAPSLWLEQQTALAARRQGGYGH